MLAARIASWILASCPLCGANSRRGLCVACRSRPLCTQRSPGGLTCCGLGAYDGMLAEGISRLKFQDETAWANHLGAALADSLPRAEVAPLLVPVPLHPRRLAERGYNQAALLARAISSQRGWKVSTRLLFRSLHTEQQARLAESSRRANVDRAFSAIAPPSQSVARAHLLLVDDVTTTGHTLDACASALRAHGYRVGGALCCALSARSSLPVAPSADETLERLLASE